ncbi:MAG: DUF262 domain-containing protein, partial [Candidatus Sungbacteria bacterium]|nr:DUF262 domain-containing protein [Candidatus Sungbacteria bacterium]
DFQRKYVWPIKKASKLIESFLLGLPVPQVFLYQEASKRDLLVVDGQQRLLSSHSFLQGKFEDGTAFHLRGVKQKWEGKNFDDLEESDKRRLKNYILRATIFEQIDPKDDKSVYEIFERLNTGGMPLTEQEVRNCVNRGNINAFLEKLNSGQSWRQLLGKNDPDKRMKDIEIILRVLALIENWKSYEKPMKDSISGYMEKYVNISEVDQSRLQRLFETATDTIFNQVGSSAFHLTVGRVNVAVLDSVLTSVALLGPEKIDKMKDNLELLKINKSYMDYVSKSTTDNDSVKGRIKMAMEAFGHKA